MPFEFATEITRAVLAHMNSDHADDSLLIVRAFGPDANATSAVMTGFDGSGGDWSAASARGSATQVRIPWLGGEITERTEVRREIVALYDVACGRLGVTPRPH